MTLDEVRSTIQDRPMNGTQVLVVAICVVINMLDGFDILAASLIAPSLAEEWGLGPLALGTLISAGPAGMAAGAFFLSSIADIFGRRTSLIMCLSLMSVGMLASSIVTSLEPLVVLRFITGLGVGAMASCTGTMVVEFSNTKRKELGLGLVTAGYPLGVVVGGALAVWLIAEFGWRSVFVLGGVSSALLIPVVLFIMPESIDFLTARRARNALSKVNTVLKRLEIAALDALPPAPQRKGSRVAQLADLVRQPLLPRFAAMALTYFLYMVSSYFILGWATTLTTQSGASLAGGISISVFLNLGGIAGALIIGLICLPLGLARATIAGNLLLGLAIILFGFMDRSLVMASFVVPFIGFGIFGAAMALYATAATVFPARVRATGIGMSMSAGRVGSVVGPYAAGVLQDGGIGRAGLCILLALPAILAAFMVTRVWAATREPQPQAAE